MRFRSKPLSGHCERNRELRQSIDVVPSLREQHRRRVFTWTKIKATSILSDQENVMALNYRFEKNRRLVLITGVGVIGPDEIVANREALLSDPDFDRSFDALVDFTQVPETSLNSDALRTLSREPLFSRASRIAVVTTLPLANMTLFGMARLYETYREVANMGDHLRVFKTLEDAREWLGADEPPSHDRLRSTG
jgi:hypothetical protein